jgi:hypothetical protein
MKKLFFSTVIVLSAAAFSLHAQTPLNSAKNSTSVSDKKETGSGDLMGDKKETGSGDLMGDKKETGSGDLMGDKKETGSGDLN